MSKNVKIAFRFTPYNVGSVLWRLFSTLEVVQYISTVGDNISTVEGIQYCGGITAVHMGDNSSTYGG